MRICVHLRVAVTVIYLLETDKLRQSYDIKNVNFRQLKGEIW
jgi:hypothetical protein